uniref:BTB domain-containing protein n=1 Tax=Strongyloides papillosus TaxID=174720 RepID=A0A0N5BTA1_STREA
MIDQCSDNNRSRFSDPSSQHSLLVPTRTSNMNSNGHDSDDDVVPETQYSISNFRYNTPFNRNDAIVHFDLNGKSFFKKVFKAFPLSKVVQFRFTKDKLEAMLEQTKSYSFSVAMEKGIFPVYDIQSEEAVLLSMSSRLFLHIINRLKKNEDLMRFCYNGEGSDVVIDILGQGEYMSSYIPTIECTRYKRLSMLEMEKDVEVILSPTLLLRVLKHAEKSMKFIKFSFEPQTFEIVSEGKETVRVLNVMYNDTSYVHRLVKLEGKVMLDYPLAPLTLIQKALRIGREVNFSIYKNGLMHITINATDMSEYLSNFELYVVPIA